MGEFADKYSCDEKCSDFPPGSTVPEKSDKDISNLLWIKHMLPQLRGIEFYGKTITEAVQVVGETLYAPNFFPHAVLNLDQTVAITDNPYFPTAIDESAFELHKDGLLDFGR